MREISIRRPDDMHFHPRSGEMLELVLRETSKVFSRGVVMGNLPEPVVTADDAKAYLDEIVSVDKNFVPIMTIMLTPKTTPQVVKDAFDLGFKVIKYIPGGTSTNSSYGIPLTELANYFPVLEKAQDLGMIFSGHWESVYDRHNRILPEIEREENALRFLDPVVKYFPRMKVVVEHASTKTMIEYVKRAPDNVAATLTVHHALLLYEDVCDGNGEGNPHHYCKPIAKCPEDRDAVVKAMVSGNPKFFFGSDSAPHPISQKEKPNSAAGIFTAPVVMPLLCSIFEQATSLSLLGDFVSKFGARFYGLSLNSGSLTLKKESWTVPEHLGNVRIFKGGQQLSWRVKE